MTHEKEIAHAEGRYGKGSTFFRGVIVPGMKFRWCGSNDAEVISVENTDARKLNRVQFKWMLPYGNHKQHYTKDCYESYLRIEIFDVEYPNVPVEDYEELVTALPPELEALFV